MGKSQDYIDYIFSDTLVFEKEVLHVSCDADRKEIMTLMSKDICEEGEMSAKVNFLKIKSIDELDFSMLNIAIVQIILAELFTVLKEKRCSNVEMNAVKNNKENLTFIYRLVKTYLNRFSNVFYKEVVNTFFDLVSIAHRPESLSAIVNEVINGSEKHNSLIEHHDGGQVLYKPEQAWMRVKQAREDMKRKVQVHQIEIVSILKRIDYLKLHISAIVAARSLSLNEVKNVTPVLLLDMFTDDEDIHLHTKKTMFSYVSAGEQANVLANIAQMAKSQSKDLHVQNDYKRIAEFFTRCKTTNTKEFLLSRLESYKHELEIKSERYRRERLEMQTLREKPLDSFDATLARIKESMVYNLQAF